MADLPDRPSDETAEDLDFFANEVTDSSAPGKSTNNDADNGGFDQNGEEDAGEAPVYDDPTGSLFAGELANMTVWNVQTGLEAAGLTVLILQALLAKRYPRL